jgi:signal transduction histidine kinase
MSDPRRPPSLLALTFLGVVYVGACHLGLMFALVNRSATPIWPGTAIAFCAFLLLGRQVWPVILLGAFLVNMTTAGTVATSIGIAVGNTLEGFAGAALVARWAGGRGAFDKPQDVFKFVALAGMLSTTISATMGVVSLALGGFASWRAFGSIWFTWWLGDLSGDLVIAPFLVLWAIEPRVRWNRDAVAELAALLVSLLLVTSVIFGGAIVPQTVGYPLEFLCAPLLVWAAFRFGPRETATATLIVGFMAMRATLHGDGPFVRADPNGSLLLMQAFNATNSVMALALAAVVRERRRAQEALAQQATVLAQSNADLEQFARVASHDLREPLRVVTSYVELLARRYRGRLDADADDFIRYAVDGTRRMRDLIDGVLAFSRAGKENTPAAMTHSGEALDRAIGNLKLAIEECDAVVTSDGLPSVPVHPVQMTQIFENLIANALKFRRSTRPAIRVGAVRNGREWVFSVADNGIGIKPQFLRSIFRIFARLHARDEFPGVGIGLSICKNIVERYGGRIWVESEPGRGSTFFFALPAEPGASPALP